MASVHPLVPALAMKGTGEHPVKTRGVHMEHGGNLAVKSANVKTLACVKSLQGPALVCQGLRERSVMSAGRGTMGRGVRRSVTVLRGEVRGVSLRMECVCVRWGGVEIGVRWTCIVLRIVNL